MNNIIGELRERKLWPVALVLVVALIAVPLLLSKQASPPAANSVSSAGLPVVVPNTGPNISVQSTPSKNNLTGPAHDPFVQQALPATTAGVTSSGSSAGASGAGSGSSSGAGGSSGSTGGTGSHSGGPTATLARSGSATGSFSLSLGGPTTPVVPPSTPPPPSPAPAPAPVGLTANESYHVALALTNASGGLNTIDPLERLSILPNQQQPLLVELGVLQGGQRVLFAVPRGTVVSGPGTCTPGPIDCEVLSLGVDQTEQLSVASSGGVVPVALFAVTAINVDHHPSVTDANRARLTASAAGASLLGKLNLSALSLFRYVPGLGAVVDLRNLKVGGS